MADEFDYNASQDRFNERKRRIDEFYRYLDTTYKSLTIIPESGDREAEQKLYIEGQLSELERRIDEFKNELRYN